MPQEKVEEMSAPGIKAAKDGLTLKLGGSV